MNHKGRRLILVLAMLLVSIIPVGIPLPSLKQAHAAGPNLVHSIGCLGSAGVCTLTLSPAAGDVIVITSFGSSGSPTVTDSQSQTYTVTSHTGGVGTVTTAYTLELATASLTITVTGGINYAFAYDLNSATTTGICQANGFGTGASLSTSTSCTIPAGGGFEAAIIPGINAIAGPTLGTGYSAIVIFGKWGMYSTGGVTSPTNFPATNSGLSTTWGDGGIMIPASAQPGTATFLVPCTFFQLQCWWYPLFFNISFAVTYLVVAFMADASTKAEIFMLLSGLSVSGLISIILAVLPITFPLLMVIAHIAYTLRLRGII